MSIAWAEYAMRSFTKKKVNWNRQKLVKLQKFYSFSRGWKGQWSWILREKGAQHVGTENLRRCVTNDQTTRERRGCYFFPSPNSFRFVFRVNSCTPLPSLLLSHTHIGAFSFSSPQQLGTSYEKRRETGARIAGQKNCSTNSVASWLQHREDVISVCETHSWIIIIVAFSHRLFEWVTLLPNDSSDLYSDHNIFQQPSLWWSNC